MRVSDYEFDIDEDGDVTCKVTLAIGPVDTAILAGHIQIQGKLLAKMVADLEELKVDDAANQRHATEYALAQQGAL